MTGVGSKRTSRRPLGSALSAAMGMLEIAVRDSGITSVSPNDALMAGSSQHGNARRASVASNCVLARCSVFPLWVS